MADKRKIDKKYEDWMKDIKKYNNVNSSCLQNRLYEMIKYSASRLQWYDEQRQKYLQISVALIGASIAFISPIDYFAQQLNDGGIPKVSFICAISITPILLLSGLIIMKIYNYQVRGNYIHREFADIRSWYFIYNFPKDLEKVMLSKEEDIKKEQTESVSKSFERFVESWGEFAGENSERFILEDLEQVFILQLFQKYRRKSLKHLKCVLSWCIYLVSAITIIGYISYVCFLTK